MQLPLDITWRGVEPSPHVDRFVRRRVERLQRFAHQINRCSVAIEKQHEHPQSGSGWRVRIDMTMPRGHELVVVRESWQGSVRDDLYSVVKDAFSAARRQIQRLSEIQRGEIKRHVEQDLDAVVTGLFSQGYGFVTTAEGREIYFHENSVVDFDFDRLKVGMGVAFTETPGEKGPQISTLRVVDRRGHESPSPERGASTPPLS